MAGADERNPVEELAEEFLQRHRDGETPTVTEYAERHPALSAEIRALFPTMLAVEGFKEEKVRTQPSISIDLTRVPRLGDYRLIRVIGRGGMGVVYEAEQESLGRPVAVKVLPESSLSSARRLERFQREARTAARLVHSNIVPVFGVGKQDDLHYYVMRLIDGVGLDVVLATLAGDDPPRGTRTGFSAAEAAELLRSGELSDGGGAPAPGAAQPAAEGHLAPATPDGPGGSARYFRNVARLGVQVADALQYAHEQGTLHRDIKPANLLLDGDGHVWVTDFGIAKALELEGVTLSGDLLGTLQYMAPEQTRGEADARSDVCSLGLTLYELLARRRAYDGAAPGSLIKKIQSHDPPPPGQIDPAIPRDLETITMKAVAREPARRYASARELADDLERFLADRPIHARPAMPIEVAWRWCRRNPAVTALGATAAVALLVAVVAGWWGYLSKREALSLESRRAEEARLAGRRAERNLALSLEAFDDIFDRVAGRDPVLAPVSEDDDAATTEQPLVSMADAELLGRILDFYDHFAVENADNERLRRETARAHRRVGDINQRLAQLERSYEAYTRALDHYASLADEAAHDPELAVEIANVHNQLGRVRRRMKPFSDVSEVLASHEAALSLLEPFAGAADALRARCELVRTHNLIADRSRWRRRRGVGRAERRRRREEAVAQHRRALALADELVRLDPGKPDFRVAQAESHRYLYHALRHTREHAEAQSHLDRAVEILREVAAAYPKVPDYRYELAVTLELVHSRSPLPSDDAAIRERLTQAYDIIAALAKEHPTVPEYRSRLARIAGRLAAAVAPAEPERADRLYAEAIEVARALLDENSSLIWTRAGLARSCLLYARQLLSWNEPERAVVLLTDSLELGRHYEPRGPEVYGAAHARHEHYRLLAEAFDQLGDDDGAADARRRMKEAARVLGEMRKRRRGRRPPPPGRPGD